MECGSERYLQACWCRDGSARREDNLDTPRQTSTLRVADFQNLIMGSLFLHRPRSKDYSILALYLGVPNFYKAPMIGPCFCQPVPCFNKGRVEKDSRFCINFHACLRECRPSMHPRYDKALAE